MGFKKKPSVKYVSSVVLTEQLDNPYFDLRPGEVELPHGETEADCWW